MGEFCGVGVEDNIRRGVATHPSILLLILLLVSILKDESQFHQRRVLPFARLFRPFRAQWR